MSRQCHGNARKRQNPAKRRSPDRACRAMLRAGGSTHGRTVGEADDFKRLEDLQTGAIEKIRTVLLAVIASVVLLGCPPHPAVTDHTARRASSPGCGGNLPVQDRAVSVISCSKAAPLVQVLTIVLLSHALLRLMW
jgi:hypothetical protein